MAMPAADDQMSVKVDLPFKCKIPDCEYNIIGFDRQDTCDKHMEKAHEYTGSALEYCLRNMRKCLGITNEENNAASASDGKTLAVPTLTKEGNSPGATPMSRGLTAGSETSNLLKPSHTSGKGESSAAAAMKRSASTAEFADKGQKGDAGAATGTSTKATPTDLWAKSLVSPEALSTVFGCFDHLGQPRELPDLFDVDDTPSPPSAATDTPETSGESRPSDGAETADLNRDFKSLGRPFNPDRVIFGEIPVAAPKGTGNANKDDEEDKMEWELPAEGDAYTQQLNDVFGQGATTGCPFNVEVLVDEEGYVLNYEEALGPWR